MDEWEKKRNSTRLEYTSSRAYGLLTSRKVRLRKLWSFILEHSVQNRNWRQDIKFLQKLPQRMYFWWRFNIIVTPVLSIGRLIVIPERFFWEHDWAAKKASKTRPQRANERFLCPRPPSLFNATKTTKTTMLHRLIPSLFNEYSIDPCRAKISSVCLLLQVLFVFLYNCWSFAPWESLLQSKPGVRIKRVELMQGLSFPILSGCP